MKNHNLINILDKKDVKKHYYAYKALVKFLIENDALHEYLEELHQKGNPFQSNFGHIQINEALDCTFSWVKSKKGDDYWAPLYDNFCNLIENLENLNKY